MLIKLDIPAGIQRIGTLYQALGRWYDSSLIRWHEGAMQALGGWTQRTQTAAFGKARAMLAWSDNDGLRWIAIGTHSHLYALSQTSDAPVDITPSGFTAGDADAASGAGYGIGPYGESTYGTPRVDNATVQEASMWTLDNFGEVLVGIMAQDSVAYSWSPPDTGVLAAAISNAPAGSALVVTPERFLMILGAGGDNRKVQWADQETLTTWSPTATNQAGDFTVETQGKLMCGKRIRGGTLIFTDMDAHLATYIGLPFVYRFDRIGENCGIASRGAVVVADTRAIWMGNRHFYAFDGAVREMACEVRDGVFGDINWTQRSKISAHHEPQFSEVWWFYPSGASTENDRAVVYNYAEDHWRIEPDIARLSAAPRGVFNNPIMADADGYLWDHETGVDYDGATPYAESGPYELGNGDQIMRARRLISDEGTSGEWRATFYTRDWPNDTETTHGPYTLSNPTPIRFAGRQARMKVELITPASTSRWGVPRVDVSAGSKR